jgi:hypothetical protein
MLSRVLRVTTWRSVGDIWRPYAESRVAGYDLAARGPQWLQESVSGEGELTEALEKLLGNAGASLGN